MKKYLFPLLCCILVSVSCVKESTFSITNYKSFVISHDNILSGDNGYAMTVTENSTGSETWKTPGRYYITCDILNRNFEIRLKELNPVSVMVADPISKLEKETDDPVEIVDNSVSGGYLNLVLDYYYNPASNYAHRINFYWEAKGSEVYLYLIHDGNGENPAAMSEESLKTREEIISVPLNEILSSGEYYVMRIVLYELNGKTIERNTYRIAGN